MLNRLKSFLQGRYGNDQLNIFLIILGCVTTLLLTLLVPSRFYYLRSLGSVIYLIALLRALSKNFPQRQKENAKFLELSEPWRKFLYKKYNQIRTRPTAISTAHGVTVLFAYLPAEAKSTSPAPIAASSSKRELEKCGKQEYNKSSHKKAGGGRFSVFG